MKSLVNNNKTLGEILSKQISAMSTEDKERVEKESEQVVTDEILKHRTIADIDGLIHLFQKVKADVANGNFEPWQNFLLGRGEEIIDMTHTRFSANYLAWKKGMSVSDFVKSAIKEINNED